MKERKTIDVYQMVTDQIISQLEQGVVPWRKSWADTGLPQNLITKKTYRGINVMLLNSLDYANKNFLTFKQLKEIGGSIKTREKPSMIVNWNRFDVEDKASNEVLTVQSLVYHLVFNVQQCEGIPENLIQTEGEKSYNPIKLCQDIFANMPKRPEIKSKGQKAYYHPGEDFVNVPKMKTFKSVEDYYGILFRELIHSTGHSSRLFRKELSEHQPLEFPAYSIEELTADIGACYLKSAGGILDEEIEDNVTYIDGWLERLKSDKKLIVHASMEAQKAVDYILNARSTDNLGGCEFS